MVALVLGHYTRVRWRSAEAAVISAINQPSLTTSELDALLDGAEMAWGLAPGEKGLLTGVSVTEPEEIEPVLASNQLSMQSDAPPVTGDWLVGVQHASHCWAVLRDFDQVELDEVSFRWVRVALSGIDGFLLGRPICRDQPFELVYPPPPERERQAALDSDGTTLRIAPFRPEKGTPSVEYSPAYRYGLLRDGTIRWLDLPAGEREYPTRPATDAFRAKLTELKAELESRGVFYMDAPDEKYHHRHSFEDAWDYIPKDFGEENPPVAYSVSGEHDNTNKDERADALFNPEGDEALLDYERIGFRTLPSEVDVTDTDIIYVGGHADGRERSQRWTGWTIAAAAKELGFEVRWGGSPTSSITVGTADSSACAHDAPLPLTASEVALRTHRIAPAVTYVARAGLETAAAEKIQIELQQRVDLLLRLRGAVHLAEKNDFFAAFDASAAVQASEFVSRSVDVWPSGEQNVTPQAPTDAFDVKVGFHICELAAMRNGTDEAKWALLALRDAWSTYVDAKLWAESINRWVEDIVKPVLACGDPTAKSQLPAESQSDLEELITKVGTSTFIEAWHAAHFADRMRESATLLRHAVASERFETAEALIAQGISLIEPERVSQVEFFGSMGGKTPLFAAIQAGSLAGVRFCLDRGADPTVAEIESGKTVDGEVIEAPTPAVIVAAKFAQTELLRLFLDLGGDPLLPTANGITPLTAAAFGGSVQCLEILIAAGADPCQPPPPRLIVDGPSALTPLLYACDRGHDDAIMLLLSYGADPNQERTDAELVLQLVMQNCRSETIQALITGGADPCAVNRDGIDVLHTAVLRRRVDIVPMILAAGAMPDRSVDPDTGLSPLMTAAAQGEDAIVAMLLEAGADPLRRSVEHHETALDLTRLAADPDRANDSFDRTIALLVAAERRAYEISVTTS